MEKLLLSVQEAAGLVGVSQSAQVAADLRAAADVLRRDGWTQGAFTDCDGRHCVQGALNVVPARDVSYSVLTVFLGSGLMPWNDTPGRTADEVDAALLAAADAAEVQS